MNKKQIPLLAAFLAAKAEFAVVDAVAVETIVEGLPVPFISKADLMENKR